MTTPIPMTEDLRRDLLVTTLQVAVPVWVSKLAGQSRHRLQKRARRAARTIAAQGDVLLFGGTGCAAAFNALAEGIAIAAHTPGGITIFGVHWDLGRPDQHGDICCTHMGREVTT